MPGKSRPTSTGGIVSDEAIRQRAYFMWEADGRPEGRNDHYWHLAHAEATRALVEETATRTAKATRGKNPSEIPTGVKAGNKATASKAKARVDGEVKTAKAKPAEAKVARKQPRPRAAIQKAP